MSAIKQALNKLDASIRKLESAAQRGDKASAAQAPVLAARPKANGHISSEALARRLDSAIGKVEQILTENAA